MNLSKHNVVGQTAKLSASMAAILGGVGIAFLATAATAHAQTYVGDAYGANVSINAPLVGGIGATIVDNPNLPSSGSSAPLTNQLLNANVGAQTGNFLAPVMTTLTANTINTSTMGTGGVATSVSQIQGLNVLPNIGLNVLGLGGLNLNSLVQADVIRTTTTANALGSTGRTEIANLRFGGNSLGNIDVSSAAGTSYYLNLLGNVSTTASTSLLVPDVARIVINDQFLTDGGSTRTTNALTLQVLQGNALANGTITLASSTAGVKNAAPSAVPESGSLSLLCMGGAGMLFSVGMITRRRRVRGLC